MNDRTARWTSPLMRRIAGRAAGAVAVMALALCAQMSVASAAPSITVSPSSAAPASTVTIAGNVPSTGTPSCPSDPVQLVSTAALFPGDGFGPQVTRDASGDFHTDYVIPATTPAGSYSIGLRCGGANVGITATLHVTGSTTLANTGSSIIGPLFCVGLALVTFGLLPFTGRLRVAVRRSTPRTRA